MAYALILFLPQILAHIIFADFESLPPTQYTGELKRNLLQRRSVLTRTLDNLGELRKKSMGTVLLWRE